MLEIVGGCGSGLVRLTRQFELPSDTLANGCLDAHDHDWHGVPALLCLRVFVPQARPSGQVCSEHQPSCLPQVSSSVCRNVDSSLGHGSTWPVP